MSSVYRSHLMTSADGDPVSDELEAVGRCVLLLEACRRFVHHAQIACQHTDNEVCKKQVEDEAIQFGLNVSEIARFNPAQLTQDVLLVASKLGVQMRPMATGGNSHVN